MLFLDPVLHVCTLTVHPVIEFVRFPFAVAEGGRRSATEVARSLGVSLSSLREYYPAKVAMLADLHRWCREEARRARYEAQERAVRDAVASLVREGVYPSVKRVFDRAGLGTGLDNPRLKAVWRDAQRRVGIVLP